MAQTTHGYPYPVGTDKLIDGDDAIKALATKIETKLQGGTWSGRITTPGNHAPNTVVSVVITWPSSLFTVAPNISATVITSTPQYYHASASTPSTSGATIYVANTYTGTAGVLAVDVIAHQTA